MTITTLPWDPVEHLATAEDIAEYLSAALEDGDPKLVAAAIGDVARARGMSTLSRETGLSRESLYRALSADGNPEFGTIIRVLRVLGVRLEARPTTDAA
jgi:probable addiction module antidote protein